MNVLPNGSEGNLFVPCLVQHGSRKSPVNSRETRGWRSTSSFLRSAPGGFWRENSARGLVLRALPSPAVVMASRKLAAPRAIRILANVAAPANAPAHAAEAGRVAEVPREREAVHGAGTLEAAVAHGAEVPPASGPALTLHPRLLRRPAKASKRSQPFLPNGHLYLQQMF